MIYSDPEFIELIEAVITKDYRHSRYDDTVEHATNMSVHILGEKPEDLLNRARPREDEAVKQYRLDNWEPTTKAGADKAIDILSKIFNPSISSIRWKDDAGTQAAELKEYTLEYFASYNSIISYNKDVVLRKMVADPNAVIAIKPGPLEKDQSKRLKPEPVIYGSKNVYYFDRDHYLIFIRTERIVNQDYHYFDYFDNNTILQIKAWYDGSAKEAHVEEVYRYDHNFNEIPVWKLRGKTKTFDNGETMYESFFSSALPHWNLAIIHESDLMGAYITHMHPQKYEMTEDCGFQYPYEGQHYPCRGGTIKYGHGSGEGKSIDCPSCGGSGRQAVKSPFGTYQFNRDKLEENPSGILPVGYVVIPTEATKMLDERTEKMIQKGMWAINMDIEEKVGENQSGKAKVIDRSAQHDFLFTVGSVVFDIHLQNEYHFINKYMFGEEAKSMQKDEPSTNLPEINKPTQFDIASTSELINNYGVAKESGLDRNFLRLREIEILSRDLSTNPDLKNFQIVMLGLDPLPGLSLEEVDLGTMRGLIKKSDAVIHLNLKPFMDKAVQEDKQFLQKQKQEQLAVFEGYAKELIASEKPKIDESKIIPPGNE